MSGPASPRASSGRSATESPIRDKASARLVPTMPKPRTRTSYDFIVMDCRQRLRTARGPNGQIPDQPGCSQMPQWIRRSLYVLLGLVLVLAAIATWLVTSFDPNRVKGAAVDWMKVQRHRTLVIDGPIELSVFPRLAVKPSRLSWKPPWPLTIAAWFAFRQRAVRGELGGGTKLTLDTASASAALREMDLRFKGDVPGASGVDAAIQGGFAWDGARKALDAQDLRLQLAARTEGMKLAVSRIAIDRFSFDPARKTLALRNLQARILGTQCAQPLSLELDWPELEVAGNKLGGSAFSGRFSRAGAMPLEATFKSTAPTGGFDAVRLPGFVAQVASHAPQRKLDGTLRADLTLKPGEPSLAFDKLELQARIEEPKLPAYALGVRGAAVASTKRSSWNLQGQLNQNTFASDGTATLSGVTPQVIARARFDTLHLNRL